MQRRFMHHINSRQEKNSGRATTRAKAFLPGHLPWLALVYSAAVHCSEVPLRSHSSSPLSATSLRPLRSSDRLDLYVPRVRTAMVQFRSFACIGPSLWNGLPPPVRYRPTAILSAWYTVSLHFFL